MPVSVNWGTKVIYVPLSYLTPLGGVFYELDVHELKKDVGALLAGDKGIVFEDAFEHNTPVLLSGILYDRFVEFIAPYTVEFESGAYVVNCTGANHNIADVKSADIPAIIVNNSAGRTIVEVDNTPSIVTVPSVIEGPVEVEVEEDEVEVEVEEDEVEVTV